MTYCLDTSALIHAAIRAYPFKNVPTFWTNLERLIADGNVVCPRAVIKEIEKKDDELHAWVKKRQSSMTVEHDLPMQAVVSQIMADSVMAKLVNIERDRSGADPFVIGLAKSRGLTLVTQEDKGKAGSPKIPNVADMLGVKHIKLVDLMIAENWIL